MLTMDSGRCGDYGMSAPDRVDIPVGTCLLASPGGAIVGVQLTPSTRYTPSRDDPWWKLAVGNAWGLFLVTARSTGVDRAKKPTFATGP
jgi:hypothetical protein